MSGLDADMQQPTACRKDEGDRVRRVAPKLIANGESHALERGTSPARGLRIGLSRGGEARGDGGEGGVLVGARRRRATAERHAKKFTLVRKTEGHACVECQRGTMEEST